MPIYLTTLSHLRWLSRAARESKPRWLWDCFLEAAAAAVWFGSPVTTSSTRQGTAGSPINAGGQREYPEDQITAPSGG